MWLIIAKSVGECHMLCIDIYIYIIWLIIPKSADEWLLLKPKCAKTNGLQRFAVFENKLLQIWD